MKTKMMIAGLFAFGLTSVGLSQVDTLRTQPDTIRMHDTIREKETVRIVRDTVKVPAEPERPKLKVGEFGVRFLPTFTSLTFNTYDGSTVRGDATVSYGYGVMGAVNFSKNFGLQAEVNYNEISQKYKDRGLDRQVDLSYLNIPVLLSFNTNKTMPVNFNVVVGPQFGLNVGASTSARSNGNTETVQATVAVKQGDIGVAYGAGFEFALNRLHTFRFDLGFRGMYGLVDMSGAPRGNDAYSITVKGSRKAYGGYAGLTLAF